MNVDDNIGECAQVLKMFNAFIRQLSSRRLSLLAWLMMNLDAQQVGPLLAGPRSNVIEAYRTYSVTEH